MTKIRLLFAAGIFFLFSASSIGQSRYKDVNYWTANGLYNALNARGRTVQKTARQIQNLYPGNYSVSQVCAAFSYLYDNWSYVSDPNGREYFMDANTVLKTFTGDCDDYAIGMVSLIVALGGDARIVAVSGHAFPEVYLGKDLSETDLNNIFSRINSFYSGVTGISNPVREMNYHIDKDKTYWLNLDWQTNYPGGYFHDSNRYSLHLVVYSDGTYRTSYLNME